MTTALTDQRDQTIATAFAQYGQRLFRFIRGRVSSNADAEDILQDVWYQFSKVVDVEPIEQVSGWLFRVARNRLTDRYRKKQPSLLDDLVASDTGQGEWFRDLLLTDDSNPEFETMKEIFWEALEKALNELPPAQRDVFIWNELEDETFQSISDRTGVNIKTLISRKRYAVAYLREQLEDLYHDFLDF